MQENATVSYIRKTGKKKRLITTYANNENGKNLRIHHKIQMHYIENYLKKNDFSFAYIKKRSTKDMVTKHLNSKFFLYVDIRSFFNSIDLDILKEKARFLETKNLSHLEICNLIDSCKIKDNSGIAIGLIPSAFFSNVYLNDFDYMIHDVLQSINPNFIYTRYSDDIVISCSDDFDFEKIKVLVNEKLSKLKLELHNTKSQYKTLDKKNSHIKVLGLNIVRGDKSNYVTVSRKFKKYTKREKNKLVKNGKLNYINSNEIRYN